MNKSDYRELIKKLTKDIVILDLSKQTTINNRVLSNFLNGDDSKLSEKSCEATINKIRDYRLSNGLDPIICAFCNKDITHNVVIDNDCVVGACNEHASILKLFDVALENGYKISDVMTYFMSINGFVEETKTSLKDCINSSEAYSYDKNDLRWFEHLTNNFDIYSKELFLAWLGKK